MDNMKTPDVPYIVHEAAMARQERTIKRLWVLCLIMFLALVVTNAGWIYYENQWEEVVTTEEVKQEIDTGDGEATVSGIGDIIYGASETVSKEDNKNKEEENRQ